MKTSTAQNFTKICGITNKGVTRTYCDVYSCTESGNKICAVTKCGSPYKRCSICVDQATPEELVIIGKDSFITRSGLCDEHSKNSEFDILELLNAANNSRATRRESSGAAPDSVVAEVAKTCNADDKFAVPGAASVITEFVHLAEVGQVVRLPLTLIKPNPNQPRKFFDELSVESLGKSCIDKQDVKQPILVVKCDEDTCVMIVDGERRWRAAKHAGLQAISCLIKPPMSEIDIFVESAVTNFGREDMSPIEEAHALKRIMDEKGLNQSELSALVGKHPAQISNILKYLKLDREIQALVITRKLDKGIGLQLATYQPQHQTQLLKELEGEVGRRGGKKIHPNEASRFLRGVAEKQGLAAAPTKKGRELASHTDLTVRNLLRSLEIFEKSLNEFRKLTVSSIRGVKGSHFLDISRELQRLKSSMDLQIKRLENMD